MRSQTSPSSEAVRTELRRLYVKRSAIDRLIDALTLYSRHAHAVKVLELQRKGPGPIRRELAVKTGS